MRVLKNWREKFQPTVRGGKRTVESICDMGEGGADGYRYCGILVESSGRRSLQTWRADGRFFSHGEEADLDLMPAEKPKAWRPFTHSELSKMVGLFLTKEKANGDIRLLHILREDGWPYGGRFGSVCPVCPQDFLDKYEIAPVGTEDWASAGVFE